MSPHFAGWDEHTLGLAADHVTVGLDAAGRAELRRRARAEDVVAFERAVAALHVASLDDLEPMPVDLARRIAASALPVSASVRPEFARAMRVTEPNPTKTRNGSTSNETQRSPRAASVRTASAWAAYAGWLAAAALLVAYVMRSAAAPARDPSARREELVTAATDLVRVEWKRTEDPLAGSAGGDVVWSAARQAGFMRFRGLRPNEPTREQYQLWIFDRSRGDWEAKPIDGGVFDVPAVSEVAEVVIPIDPKLDVREAVLFAVTLELPRGVVVSKREHLLLTATP